MIFVKTNVSGESKEPFVRLEYIIDTVQRLQNSCLLFGFKIFILLPDECLAFRRYIVLIPLSQLSSFITPRAQSPKPLGSCPSPLWYLAAEPPDTSSQRLRPQFCNDWSVRMQRKSGRAGLAHAPVPACPASWVPCSIRAEKAPPCCSWPPGGLCPVERHWP